MTDTDVHPGMRIMVTRTIERRQGAWESEITGTIMSIDPQKTGSWFAHGKDDRLWLVRVNLRKDDGEVTSLILDQNTRIDVLDS